MNAPSARLQDQVALIDADFRAADALPPDERERRLNILCIKWRAELLAIARDEAIDASPKVVRLVPRIVSSETPPSPSDGAA